jgi:hypothetical protein
MDGDASSALEMNVAAFSLKCSSLTPQSCSNPSPSLNQLKDLLKGRIGEWSRSLWRCFSLRRTAASEEGGGGV